METTIKYVNVRLTKEQLKELTQLINKLGESQSQIFRRALADLYRKTFQKEC